MKGHLELWVLGLLAAVAVLVMISDEVRRRVERDLEHNRRAKR
jgi:hypothetical protein